MVEVVVEKQCWSCVGGGGAPGELAGDCQSGVYAWFPPKHSSEPGLSQQFSSISHQSAAEPLALALSPTAQALRGAPAAVPKPTADAVNSFGRNKGTGEAPRDPTIVVTNTSAAHKISILQVEFTREKGRLATWTKTGRGLGGGRPLLAF